LALVFSNQLISEWIKAILKLQKLVTIPRKDTWKFQTHVVVNMDHIWFAKNQLIPNGMQTVISTSVSISSIWSSLPPGSIKANFDVAIRWNYAMAAIVLSDYYDGIMGISL
jgi:hypothetical protein